VRACALSASSWLRALHQIKHNTPAPNKPTLSSSTHLVCIIPLPTQQVQRPLLQPAADVAELHVAPMPQRLAPRAAPSHIPEARGAVVGVAGARDGRGWWGGWVGAQVGGVTSWFMLNAPINAVGLLDLHAENASNSHPPTFTPTQIHTPPTSHPTNFTPT